VGQTAGLPLCRQSSGLRWCGTLRWKRQARGSPAPSQAGSLRHQRDDCTAKSPVALVRRGGAAVRAAGGGRTGRGRYFICVHRRVDGRGAGGWDPCADQPCGNRCHAAGDRAHVQRPRGEAGITHSQRATNTAHGACGPRNAARNSVAAGSGRSVVASGKRMVAFFVDLPAAQARELPDGSRLSGGWFAPGFLERSQNGARAFGNPRVSEPDY
jgi:hypothetical protein